MSSSGFGNLPRASDIGRKIRSAQDSAEKKRQIEAAMQEQIKQAGIDQEEARRRARDRAARAAARQAAALEGNFSAAATLAAGGFAGGVTPGAGLLTGG